MGKLSLNPFLSQKNDILSSLLYIPNIINYSLSKKVEELCKNMLIKYKHNLPYLCNTARWYSYACVPDTSDEERQQLKELYQDYKDSDNIVKEIKWYINRLFNVDAPLYVQKQCIPEYYWKYLVNFTNNNEISYPKTFQYDPLLNDPKYIIQLFFHQETYDLMEQQPLKAVLLGVEI